MAAFAPADFARRIGSGLLSFPVTHFEAGLACAEGPYRDVGGAPFFAQLRWIDADRRRAGLPADVAALVEAMTADTITFTLVMEIKAGRTP